MEEIAFIVGLSFGTFILFGYLLKNYEENEDGTEKATSKSQPPSNRPHTDSNDAPANPFGYNPSNLPEQETEEETDEIICNACGTRNKPSYRFCQNCIEPLIHSRD